MLYNKKVVTKSKEGKVLKRKGDKCETRKNRGMERTIIKGWVVFKTN